MKEAIKLIDQEILALYRDGYHEKSFQLFIEQYQTKLYALTYRMLGNHDDAMDALQDALLQIHRSLPTFREESSLYTWVYRITSHVCLNFRKKRSRSANHLELDETIQTNLQTIERPEENPDKMCETKYKQFLIQQALLKMPESQRTLLVLHDLEGISIPEVATILSINTNAAKSRLHRARGALRSIAEKGFIVKGMEGVGVLSPEDTRQLL